MINVNGCAHCGILEREHGQRYDGLHPPNNHGYQAPSDLMRKARLMLNIFDRRYPVFGMIGLADSIEQMMRGTGRRLR